MNQKLQYIVLDAATVSLRGSWRIDHLKEITRELKRVDVSKSTRLDGSGLEAIDTASAMVLARWLGESGASLERVSFSESHASVLELAERSLGEVLPLRNPHTLGFVGTVGSGAVGMVRTVASVLGFVGETAIEFLHAIVRPRTFRTKELVVQLESVGVNAVAIASLVTFLIGIVVAYLSGVQTEKYGANIFIVDAVAIAMCRELSPILVAIVVAGRSGSAYTAQLGTMMLNEEVDAMSTLGLSPIRVLVLPRLLALMIAMPILVFIGDLSGIFGGLLISDFRLGVTGPTFVERLRLALPMKHVVVGLIKAPVFAFFIATIGCRMGLSVERNARSVGDSTTQTVVRSIVSVILLNAAFAVVLSELGI